MSTRSSSQRSLLLPVRASCWRLANIRSCSMSPLVGHSIHCRWMVCCCRRRLALRPEPHTPTRRPSARVVLWAYSGAGDSVREAVNAGATMNRLGLCAPAPPLGCYHAAEGSRRAAGRLADLAPAPVGPVLPSRRRPLTSFLPAPARLPRQLSPSSGRLSLVSQARVRYSPPWPDSCPVALNPGSPNDAPPDQSPPESSSGS